MTDRTGAATQVAVFKETTFNTALAAEKTHQVPWADAPNLFPRQTRGNVREINPNLQPVKLPWGFNENGGSLIVPVENEMVGLLLLCILPGYTYTAGAGPEHTHDFVPLNTATPYTLGVQIGDTVADKWDQMGGLVVASMEVDLVQRPEHAHITWTLEGSGKVHNWNTATQWAVTPDTYDNDRWHLPDSVLKINTVTCTRVTEGRFRLSREVFFSRAVNGDSSCASIVTFGGWNIEGNLTGIWDSAEEIRVLGHGKSEFRLDYILHHPSDVTQLLTFTMAKCQGFATTHNVQGRRAVEVGLDWNSYFATSPDNFISAQLKSTVASLSTLWTT